jgi:2'-5' RNA ligase
VSIALLRTALLISVPEAESVVSEWRERFDPSAAHGVPAHVTLIFPFLSVARCDEAAVRWLRCLFAATPTFEFQLTEPRRFPGILYLGLEPAQPVVRLTDALVQRFPEAPPYGGSYPEFIPHLTVAHSCDEGVLREIEQAVRPGLPIRSVAREVILMRERVDGGWAVGHRFPLGPGSPSD